MREIKLSFDATKSLGVFTSEDGRNMSVLLNGDTGDIITAFSVLTYYLKSHIGLPYDAIRYIVDFTEMNEPYYQELCQGGVKIDMKKFLRQVGKDDD